MADPNVHKLFDLGYVFVEEATFATEMLRLELAVREFQTYAKLEKTAQLDLTTSTSLAYADRLKSVALPVADRYEEPVTGTLTDRTKELIQIWIDKKYRCPVVIECWGSERKRLGGTRWWTRIGTAANKPALKPYGENVWLWDEPKTKFNAPRKGRRMFVRDFTGRFDALPGYQELLESGWQRILLGRQTFKTDPNDSSRIMEDGPVSDLASQMVAIEITPERLTGNNYASLSEEAKKTYRVVRAVSEAECDGFFDTINCWDPALVSIGLCHWTIAHPTTDEGGNAVIQKGELEAFLAYAESKTANSTKVITGDSGIEPANRWADAAILNKSLRKFESQFSQLFGPIATPQRRPIPIDTDRFNFFRSWHWFYRFQTAMRTSDSLRNQMWDMARFRLRDIGTAPAGLNIKNGAGQPATLGDVFTSEQTVAWLMEWHVLSPGTMFGGVQGTPTERLTSVMRDSGVNLTRPTNQWTQNDEMNLLASLKKRSPASITVRFKKVMSCRQLIAYPNPTAGEKNLSPIRNSFKLDINGLGPSPF